MTRKHFCTIVDTLRYNDDLSIEMTYIYEGSQQWSVSAVLVGGSMYDGHVVLYKNTIPTAEFGVMMAEQRVAVEDILHNLAAMISVSPRKGLQND